MARSFRNSRVGGFWHQLTEGLTLRELWHQFRREAGTSYRLYANAVDDEEDTRSRVRRWLRAAGSLAMAMLMRLSPARRLFLLLALLLMFLSRADHHPGRAVLAGWMLFALLVMELADWVMMKRDLEIAREIQQWLVPHTPPVIEGIDCAFSTEPANTVAGDYYDVFVRSPHAGNSAPVADGPAGSTDAPVADGSAGAPPQAPGPLVVVVADVAGKSMPAALLMATFQASLRTLMYDPVPLRDVVTRLNRYSYEHSLEGRRFTTAFLSEIDRATGVLTYVNAGHNAPILRRSDGSIERLEMGGLILGVRDDASYQSGELRVQPGDLLVIFTDGVADARSRSGQQYGEQRLVELVARANGLGADAMLQRILADVEEHVGDAPQEDDITCVVVRIGES